MGVYVVGLRVTNSFGESDEVDTVINVTSPPPPVAVDVKPESCPNPLNTRDTGVLPIAIVGTDLFDVSQVDPATVMLEGSYPLRWSVEDVATPYEPFVGKEGAYDCTELGPDGYPDLVVMFSAQEILTDLGDVYDGDVLLLHLSGNLKEEFGGSAFVGEDVVRIIRKGRS